MKLALRVLTALGVLLAISPVLYAIDRKGWASQEAAGWAQAVGTAAAVLFGALIARRQMQHAADLTAAQIEQARLDAKADRDAAARARAARQAVIVRAAWSATAELLGICSGHQQRYTHGEVDRLTAAQRLTWADAARNDERLARAIRDLNAIPLAELPDDEAATALLEARRVVARLVDILGEMAEDRRAKLPSFKTEVELADDAYRRFSAVLDRVLGASREH